MTRVVAVALLCASLAAPVAAQTEGRVSVGATVSYFQPTDSAVGSLVGFGPLVRLNPRDGWGLPAGFSWFRADLNNPSGASGPFATLRVRPLMAGVSYTVGKQPVLFGLSLV